MFWYLICITFLPWINKAWCARAVQRPLLAASQYGSTVQHGIRCWLVSRLTGEGERRRTRSTHQAHAGPTHSPFQTERVGLQAVQESYHQLTQYVRLPSQAALDGLGRASCSTNVKGSPAE